MLVGSFFKLMQDLLAFVSPLVLKQMICFTKWDDIDLYYGYLYAVILVVVAVLQSFFLHQVHSPRSLTPHMSGARHHTERTFPAVLPPRLSDGHAPSRGHHHRYIPKVPAPEQQCPQGRESA